MNYFEKHIGDYIRDTAHLSLLEHGIYSRLMDVYYVTESPIPAAHAARLIGARSVAEKEALSAVLKEFFELVGDLYRQSRCDAEIERFQKKSTKARASANKRWGNQDADASSEHDEGHMRSHGEGNAPRARVPLSNHQSPDSNSKDKDLAVLVAAAPQQLQQSQEEFEESDPKPGYQVPACPAQQIVDLYHEKLPAHPHVDVLSAARKKTISARWKEVCASEKFDREKGLEWFAWFFGFVATSKFLTGRKHGARGTYIAPLFALLKPESFARVVEGFYHREN